MSKWRIFKAKQIHARDSGYSRVHRCQFHPFGHCSSRLKGWTGRRNANCEYENHGRDVHHISPSLRGTSCAKGSLSFFTIPFESLERRSYDTRRPWHLR